MKLNENWRRILGKSWSLRLVAVLGGLQILDAALPALGTALPEGVIKWLSIMAAIGAAVTRLISQPDIERRKMIRDPSKGPGQ